MKRIIWALCIISLYAIDTSAQLANQNTYLLANLNQHSGPTPYSACWGYVAPNGREYALMGCYNGTTIVDITDTTNIHEVAFVNGPAFTAGNTYTWREMKTFSHYAYIVTDVTNNAQGVQIVDLQYLPDSAHFVKYFNFSGYTKTHSIQQSGPYLYLNGGNATVGQTNSGGVHILDLSSDPENPVLRGQWGQHYVHDCRVINDTIWACDVYPPGGGGTGSVYVINAINKDNLTNINSWINLPNPMPHNVALSTDHKHIFTTDETTSPSGKLKVWNIQDLNNVILEAMWQPTGITTCVVHNVEIYGNYAVIAHYEAGIRVVDISNPVAPVEVAWYDTFPSANNSAENGCWGVYKFPSGKIMASDMVTGLYVIKTTLNLTGVNNNNGSIPLNFSLKQNYPNPFNPSTTIAYELPKNSNVTLKVYDALGKQVGLLADNYEDAGSHVINYDASRLATGIYFYRLAAGGFTDTKKMILVK